MASVSSHACVELLQVLSHRPTHPCPDWICLNWWMDGWIITSTVNLPHNVYFQSKKELSECVQGTWWLWLAQGLDLPSNFPGSPSNWAFPGCNGTSDGTKHILPPLKTQRKLPRFGFQWPAFIARSYECVSECLFVLSSTAAFKVRWKDGWMRSKDNLVWPYNVHTFKYEAQAPDWSDWDHGKYIEIDQSKIDISLHNNDVRHRYCRRLVFDHNNWCVGEVSAVILCWRNTQINITPQLRQQSLLSEYGIKIAGYKEVMVSLTVCEKTNQRNQSFPWRPAVSQYFIGDRNLTTNELFSILPIASAVKWITSLNTTVAKFY